jgi:hypothetical protein
MKSQECEAIGIRVIFFSNFIFHSGKNFFYGWSANMLSFQTMPSLKLIYFCAAFELTVQGYIYSVQSYAAMKRLPQHTLGVSHPSSVHSFFSSS